MGFEPMYFSATYCRPFIEQRGRLTTLAHSEYTLQYASHTAVFIWICYTCKYRS